MGCKGSRVQISASRPIQSVCRSPYPLGGDGKSPIHVVVAQPREEGVVVTMSASPQCLQPGNRQVYRDTRVVVAEDPETGDRELFEAFGRIGVLAEKAGPDILLLPRAQGLLIWRRELTVRIP